MAQSYNVRGEALFEQDPSVPLAVQFRDEAVPVDDQTWAEPANERFQ